MCVCVCGGACGLTVTIEGNGHCDPSSKPVWGCLYFTKC